MRHPASPLMISPLIMTDMALPKLLTLIFSLATSMCAVVAAIYWYLSSKQEPAPVEGTVASISDNPEAHIMEAQVSVYALQVALNETSRLNKIASLWSAAAAGLGAIAAICSVV
jgi:hypothetical protein